MWPRNRVTNLLRISHPIVQGPFGNGHSSVALAAAVSETGGLGSFGVHHLEPAEISAVAAELHAATTRSFALNLWVPRRDTREDEMTRQRFDAAVRRLQPLYEELGVDAPVYPNRFLPSFEEQLPPSRRRRRISTRPWPTAPTTS
jgi:nitronate monooxygenase